MRFLGLDLSDISRIPGRPSTMFALVERPRNEI